jgi:hypothetical protein
MSSVAEAAPKVTAYTGVLEPVKEVCAVVFNIPKSASEAPEKVADPVPALCVKLRLDPKVRKSQVFAAAPSHASTTWTRDGGGIATANAGAVARTAKRTVFDLYMDFNRCITCICALL